MERVIDISGHLLRKKQAFLMERLENEKPDWYVRQKKAHKKRSAMFAYLLNLNDDLAFHLVFHQGFRKINDVAETSVDDLTTLIGADVNVQEERDVALQINQRAIEFCRKHDCAAQDRIEDGFMSIEVDDE